MNARAGDRVVVHRCRCGNSSLVRQDRAAALKCFACRTGWLRPTARVVTLGEDGAVPDLELQAAS